MIYAVKTTIFTMSAPGNTVLLDLLPNAGFLWEEGQGAPMLLRARSRDKAVLDALSVLVNHEKLRNANVAPFLVELFNYLARWINDDGFLGIRDDEDIVQWLCRRRASGLFELPAALDQDVW